MTRQKTAARKTPDMPKPSLKLQALTRVLRLRQTEPLPLNTTAAFVNAAEELVNAGVDRFDLSLSLVADDYGALVGTMPRDRRLVLLTSLVNALTTDELRWLASTRRVADLARAHGEEWQVLPPAVMR
jgi:hypothetical protein